ncbi:hypothetical protein BT67DRAFT_441652, partial [Trichocladium antarcticum]
ALPGARCGRVAGSWELGVAGWAALPGAGCGRVAGSRELAGSWVWPGGPRCRELGRVAGSRELGTAGWAALLGAGYGRVKVGYCNKTTYVERAIVGIASKN